ncbi:MAG: helix-turn-helix transcriptional regulator [Clostridia bacterium]|nr:helix-turn-helix transcriptional regulator [Clostridia bacterium]
MERTWLKEMRNKENLSTYKVAKAIGMSQPYYSLIENGARRPSVKNAMAIADFFGFSWTRFFPRER